MIALPTAYTARLNSISNAQIPEELQQTISTAIASAVSLGLFTIDIPLASYAVAYEAQLMSWLKSLGYFVDYTDQPNQTGQIEVRWG